VKLLVDEMYPAALAEGLQAAGIEASTVTALKLAGSPDAEVFAAAVAGGYAVVTENVGDFARIAAEHSNAGRHHHGLLIALSSRFSRRSHGIEPLIAAIQAVAAEQFDDRIVYLQRSDHE
jgi:predicted nuclease of predicted toxin-antitoxin system